MDANYIDLYSSNLIVEKSVNTENAIVGEEIEYGITVINEGEILIDDITIIDTLASSLEFVTGSVVNGDIPDIQANVLQGVKIGCLKPGEIKNLTYKAKIVYRPESGYINNYAIAKFYYDPNMNTYLDIIDKTSNTVTIKVDIAELKIDKSSDKDRTSRGGVVTYLVDIENIGTVQARNVLFVDKLAPEVSLIPNSLKINGVQVNYKDNEISIYIGNINIDESTKIEYKVLVKSSNSSGVLCNKAAATFNYNLCNQSFSEKTVESNEEFCEVKLGISTFKQISIDQNLCIPSVKPNIEEINDMKVEAKIKECHIIDTINSVSNEGQTLSGYKLIVRGELIEILEYTSDTPEQSVHSAHYNIPFSSFIVLPESYISGSKIDVEAIVEDIYYKQIDNRCFFKNITLLINTKIMSC